LYTSSPDTQYNIRAQVSGIDLKMATY